MSDQPQESLPTSKVARAARFAKTGFKVGANYVQHYAKKAVGADSPTADLHQANAVELYGTLSEMKGSVLKVAQMLAMEKNLLPPAALGAAGDQGFSRRFRAFA
jgi:predicted unusual protein kinase regulating ubiquinone biosynthesis (AarF/ABC1/UbiB family)